MAFALPVELPLHIDPPAVVEPASREISFGRVAGTVAPGIQRVVVYVDGRESADQEVSRGRFDLDVELPPRDATVRVVALDALGNRSARTVRNVFGIPGGAARVASKPYEDPELAQEVTALVNEFPGIAGVYVENLRTGAGAAWNARARFPAASSVKVAIAIEVLRSLDARPPPTSSLARLLDLMLVESDNEAANALLAWLGGSETGGAARVNELLAAVGVEDSYLYGGFLISGGTRPPIPLTVVSEPIFVGKYTTAWDLAQLHRFLHLAARGDGPLVDEVEGFTRGDARSLLYTLAHTNDHGKLDRYTGPDVVVAHKGGWIEEARHDSGLVYARAGAFVVSVMTWDDRGAGDASDVLAGRVAEAALRRFDAERTPAETLPGFSLHF